jgi:hypothetical protein
MVRGITGENVPRYFNIFIGDSRGFSGHFKQNRHDIKLFWTVCYVAGLKWKGKPCEFSSQSRWENVFFPIFFQSTDFDASPGDFRACLSGFRRVVNEAHPIRAVWI